MTEPFTIDLHGCARCHGNGHQGLVFRPLAYPVEVDLTRRLTHWAACPTNGEPILLRKQPIEPTLRMYYHVPDWVEFSSDDTYIRWRCQHCGTRSSWTLGGESVGHNAYREAATHVANIHPQWSNSE
jgi:hypothetical protein